MTLELKHLVGYLPYGLKFRVNLSDVQENYKNELREFTLTTTNLDLLLGYGGKPILRPLSDLTKEINGVVHLVRIADLYLKPRKHTINDNKAVSKYGYLEFEISTNRFFEKDGCSELLQPTYSFDMLNYLFQHHFDVFSLIDNNLAIDINTIKL